MDSKSSGPSLRNEDRISQLPNALLLLILSSLPTKDVQATSVLSKQWRSLWKMVPNLKFNFAARNGENDLDLKRFSDNVCRSMLSLQAPVLQSFHLEVSAKKSDTIDFGVIVGIAFGLHARELVLDVNFSQGSFRFPISFYKCDTLEMLKLRGSYSSRASIILDVPSPVCLKSLRTLHLHYVFFKDEESVLNLLSGCESLESLLVHPSRNDDVKTFTIAMPSLQKLTIDYSYGDNDGSVYVINAPSLKYMEINVFRDGTCLIENVPELVKADIFISNVIVGSPTSLKHLTLEISHLEIKVPAGSSIFYQLVYLDLCADHLKSWNSLMLMLDNSPILQVLKIQSGDYEDRMEWNEPKHVPQCLSLHLKTLDWCVDGIEYGEEVAQYILENASCLENTILRFGDNNSLSEEDKIVVWNIMESMCSGSCEFDLVV